MNPIVCRSLKLKINERVELPNLRNRQAAEHHRVMHALAKASEERAAVVDRVCQNERLSLTVGYPGSPASDVWQGLFVYLHLPDAKKEVEKRLRVRSHDARACVLNEF